jgi:D-alanyl-D-alanine carboxypeptidase
MLSFLVAIVLYLTLLPMQQPLAAADIARPAEERLLPIAAESDRVAASVSAASPRKKDEGRIGVETSAKAAIAVDWDTGTVLYAKNAYEPLPIASITKLVSALVVLGEGMDPEAEVGILGGDMRPGGIQYIVPGERIRAKDLLNVSLVASSNDATAALARSTGLSSDAFVERMNALASDIGMTQAHFVEPTGLDSRNAATAQDVAVLIRHALDKQEVRDAVLRKKYAFTAASGLDHVVGSTDELLGSFLDEPPYRFLGGKTGYLGEAGYCFGAAAEDGSGHRVISVVLGAETRADRFTEVKNLLFWVFDVYAWPN